MSSEILNLRPSSYSSFSNTFTWKISLEDWTKVVLLGKHIVLKFRSYLPPDQTRVKWYIEVYPKGSRDNDFKYIEVLLGVERDGVDSDVIPQFQIEYAYRFKQIGETKPFDMFSSPTYEACHSTETEVMESVYLKDTYLVGSVEDTAVKGFLIFEFAIKTDAVPEPQYQPSLSRQRQLFIDNLTSKDEDEAAGDVKLICDGKEFSCHKLLLTSQSPVFRAMFAHDSKENADNVVTIEDCSQQAVQEFLVFLYHAKLRDDPFTSAEVEIVIGLVHLASKYQMDLLLDSCKDLLLDIMDLDNAMKLMVVVKKYPEMSEICDKVGCFMKKNISVIVKKEGWSEFYVNNQSLVTELLLM